MDPSFILLEKKLISQVTFMNAILFIVDVVQEVNSGLVLKKKGTAKNYVQIFKTSFLCREV